MASAVMAIREIVPVRGKGEDCVGVAWLASEIMPERFFRESLRPIPSVPIDPVMVASTGEEMALPRQTP